jgi:hypothetical protein
MDRVFLLAAHRTTGPANELMIERIARRFELGRLVAEPVRVPGGRSNELWRLVTDDGDFAVKRMIVNADRPGFVDNVEAAFEIERRAWAAGVAMPEPVADPSTGRALARVGASLVRVHRWVDGQPGPGAAIAAARLLASIHAVGNPRREPGPDAPWTANRWGHDLVELARRVWSVPGPVMMVDSHRDLDRKNTLLSADGVLMALDWDAAGPVGAVHEAVGLALDWCDADLDMFAEVVRTYVRCSGVAVPAQPWVFAGWVAAQGGWLDYNAAHRAGTPVGPAEVTATLARLRMLAAGLDAFLAALPRDA